MFPSSDVATQVYVAVSLMSFKMRTFFPVGILSSGVISIAPSLHLMSGNGEPTAMHVRFAEPPGITSMFSGRTEK